MPSQLKSDTARANGARSSGPKSAETREKSAHNSLKHGFTARHTLLLECENPDELTEMQDEYAAMHHPATPAEQDLVDEMIAARWRIRRLRAIEVVLFDCEMIRRKPEVEKEFLDPDSVVHMALAFHRLAEESRSSALLSRYESRLQRAHDRAYRTLRELQHARKTSEPEPPQPIRPGEAGQLLQMPAAPSKNDETNPAVPPSLQLAVARRFPTRIPEFRAMEVLNQRHRLLVFPLAEESPAQPCATL